MSYSVSGTTITMTRGDTFKAFVEITDANGNRYQPKSGDHVRFAAKASYRDEEPLIFKEIPIDTLLLVLNPEDTKSLPFSQYVYDIQLTSAGGDVDTFITTAQLIITEEVD